MNIHSISSRLLIWFSIVSLIPLIAVSVILLDLFTQRQVDSVNTYLSQVADMKENQINAYIDERLMDVRILSQSSGAIQSIEKLTNAYQKFGVKNPEYLKIEAEVRANYTPMLENYYDLFFISITGEIVFSLLHEEDFATNIFTGEHRDSALSDITRNSLSILNADISEFDYYGPSNAPASFLAAPVLKDGVIIGVTALQISTKHIYQVVMDDTGLGKSGEAVVAMQDGNEILFMAPLKFDSDAALKRRTSVDSPTAGPMKHALRGERGFGQAPDYRNEQVIAAWRYLPSLRWGLVVKRDVHEAFSGVEQIRLWSLYIMLAFISIVATIAWFMGNSIVLPIRTLTRVTSDIAAGKLDQRANISRKDEVGTLAQSFNHMAAQLQDSRDNLERRVDARTRMLDQSNIFLRQEMDERIKIEEQLQLTSTVFEHTSEAIIITDANSLVIDCNAAYTAITGYSLDEIKGKNPNIVASGQHDKSFYQDMWQSIIEHGSWRGEIWDRRKNGVIYPKWLSINSVINNDGEVSHYIGVFSDISNIKETERQLEDLAYTDTLTGLPNRQLFHDRLDHELLRAHRQESRVALFFIDLDQFKRVNDTLGHHIGDELLKEVAERLKGCVRENDTVARLGGDEFTVILSDIISSRVVADIAQKIIDLLSNPFKLGENEIFIGASIGISLYPDDGLDEELLTRNADAAMYHAKDMGRGNFQFFSEEINQRNQKRLILENNLRRAIKNREFELYYQPQIDIFTKEIIGSEALIRWNDPQKGQISPLDFIPIAEETGMILEIGEWVFREACKQLRQNIDKGRTLASVAINISAVQFKDEGLVNMISSCIKEEGIPTKYIELEITESAIMNNADEAVIILEKLSALGIRISIDDFGTGYSSLAYLKKFPVDKLKIDREFIRDLPHNPDDVILTTTMIRLANSLGIDVLAEGVESAEQIEFLRTQKCQYVQGYFYSKPLPYDEFESFSLSWTKANET